MLAIFMIVTLAAMGIYLVTVSTAQSQAVAQDVLGTRAYQAARAGIDWGTYQRLRNSSCAPSTPLSFAGWTVSGLRAEVACVEVGLLAGETEGSATVHVYRITSKGCNANPCSPANPDPNYVERELQITVTQ
jgi:MSHA biogenesis protein MshP